MSCRWLEEICRNLIQVSDMHKSHFQTMVSLIFTRSSAQDSQHFFFPLHNLSQIEFFQISVFTYRYFLCRFPELCILAVPEQQQQQNDSDNLDNEPIGCVVAKIDEEEVLANGKPYQVKTGYIGMLAVSQAYRRRGIGKALVEMVIQRMKDAGCSSVTLETEVTNVTAQRLYQDIFGFIREELLVRYYLNWNDAYRLRLWF